MAIFTAALAAVIALGGCGGASITVNGTRLPPSQFRLEVERRTALMEKNNPAELRGERGERLRAETERQVATELIRAELIREQAGSLKITVPVDEVARRLSAERQRVGDEQYEKELKAQGLTVEQFEKKLEEEALVELLGAKVSEGVTATVDEAESFYLTHRELFGRSLAVRASHVLLESESQAEVVAAEAKSGTDFATLAKMHSRDAGTRQNGGDLGWIERGTMEPALEEAIFSLKPGEVSGVVRATDGFHVVRVVDRLEASTPSFDEIKAEAISMLAGRKKEEAFSDWLRTVYANARVEVGGLGKWDPRTGIVVPR